MIHQLLGSIETTLRTAFAGVIPDPASRITAGTAVVPGAALPRIAIYAGPLEISQAATDGVSSQVRPQALRERKTVSGSSPQGPYTLAKTPLEGSLLCQVVYEEGLTGEYRNLLVENKDFTVDYTTHRIQFSTDLTGAGVLLLQYSFPGVFTVREFGQAFFVDVFDSVPADLERWAALGVSVILTNHDKLLESFNLPDPTKHTANNYLTAHTLRSLHWLEGTPALASSPYKMQLKFMTRGEIRLVKSIEGGYGLIERIHSPGKTGTADRPVVIEPDLG